MGRKTLVGCGTGGTGGGGGGGFDPTTVAGLAAWYDASTASTRFKDTSASTPATADADPVRRLNDRSGNGNHLLAPADAQRPVVKAAIQNGLDALDFSLANSTIMTKAFTLAQPCTAFLVGLMRTAGVSGVSEGVADGGSFAGAALLSYAPTSTQMYAGSNLTDTTRAVLSVWECVTMLWNGASSQLWYNTTSLMTGNAGATSPGGFTVGGLSSGGNRFVDLRFGEYLVYDSNLSAANRNAVRDYLISKWGL